MMPKQVPHFKNQNNHLGEITEQIEGKDDWKFHGREKVLKFKKED